MNLTMKNATKIALVIFALALVFTVNFVSAFTNIVDFGINGIDPSSYDGWQQLFGDTYVDNHYCSEYFGGNVPNNVNNDACACDNSGYVVCCDSINNQGIYVKNMGARDYANKITCEEPCVSINGGWSITSFDSWSVCNLNGQRMRTLTQTCDNPTPNSCGQDCTTTSGWTRSGNIQTKTEVGSCAFCIDLDGDGYNSTGGVCGVVDCDDDNENINPGMQEICDNGLDDDCDGFIDSADSECDLPDFCIDGNVENYTFINNYCNGQDIWSNFSYSLCQSNNWLSRFNQSFNFPCPHGCLNGQCVNQPDSSLSVNIFYAVI